MGKLEGKVARLASEGDDHAVQIASNSAYGPSGMVFSGTMAETELAGARVLVTGASAGIGRAVAIRAVRQGARVMLAARRRKELEAACAEAAGGECVAADLASPAGSDRVTEAVRNSFGGLDLVISCVGVAPLRVLADTGDEHWEQVLTTNVVSTHRLLRGCVPLLGRSGTFIALSSDSVLRPRSGLGAYTTSKAGLEQLIHGWRTEHPWLRFTTVTVGDTFPTDFGNAFDGEVLTRVMDEWAARGLAPARFMAPDDVARTLLAVAGTLRALPGIGVDHLVISSPSPPAASFMEAFTALGTDELGPEELGTDELGTDQGEPMVEYDPFDWETAHNPYPVYRRLRDEAPVYRNERLGFWALSRYEDVVAAHLATDDFSSAHGVTIEGMEKDAPFLIVKDPPEHTAHRKIVGRLFTPRRIAALEPFVRRTAAGLLDRLRDADRFDVVEDFSFRLPLDVISELIGIPASAREQVHHLSDRIAVRDDSSAMSEDAIGATLELAVLFTDLVRDRRAHPGDDVITMLMNTPVEEEDGSQRLLSDDELAGRFLELSFAGHETVAKLIPNGVVALAWFPDARRSLVADPSLMANAVEEMLRWDPPSHYQGRWTTRDVEVRGTVIPADQRVILVTGSAVHDERKYPDPDVFDIGRDIDRHVSFGFGRHLCLGASLARLETRVAFEELLRRFPDFTIDETGAERHVSVNVRGLAKLPLVIEARAAT